MAVQPSHDKTPSPGELDFETLVGRFYEALYRFALSLTHAESEAGDLVQETFLKWAAKGHQLEDPGKVKSWLFTTLHRHHLESRRRITRFPQLELEEAAPELPNVEPAVAERLDAQDALALLAQVDPQFKAALALFYLEDYSYAEIASILEVPIGTVKSRISRGLAQLKALVLRTGKPEVKHD